VLMRRVRFRPIHAQLARCVHTTTFNSRKHWSTHCYALTDSCGYCIVPGHGHWAASPPSRRHSGRAFGLALGAADLTPVYLLFFFGSIIACARPVSGATARLARNCPSDRAGGTRDAATSLRIEVKRPAAVTRRAERKKKEEKKGKESLFIFYCELCQVFYLQLASCSSRAVSAMKTHVLPGTSSRMMSAGKAVYVSPDIYLWSALPMDATSAGPRTPLPAGVDRLPATGAAGRRNAHLLSSTAQCSAPARVARRTSLCST